MLAPTPPSLAMRGSGNSFNRIFGTDGKGDEDSEVPSVHELFAAAMNDIMDLQEFAQMLVEYHGVHLTPSAARLLASVDAASGRLSFSQFQKALNEGTPDPIEGAGRRNIFQDQASAIIADNCGAPSAPPTQGSSKVSTDISSDREAFAKQSKQLESVQSRGAFASNPVVRTNRVSAGNPLARTTGQASEEDPYGTREMAQTAVRLYVGGELDRLGFEKFLTRMGIKYDSESELRKLIETHEKVGDGNFVQFMRVVQKELAKVGCAAPLAA